LSVGSFWHRGGLTPGAPPPAGVLLHGGHGTIAGEVLYTGHRPEQRGSIMSVEPSRVPPSRGALDEWDQLHFCRYRVKQCIVMSLVPPRPCGGGLPALRALQRALRRIVPAVPAPAPAPVPAPISVSASISVPGSVALPLPRAVSSASASRPSLPPARGRAVAGRRPGLRGLGRRRRPPDGVRSAQRRCCTLTRLVRHEPKAS
jgi:hypothetical protein